MSHKPFETKNHVHAQRLDKWLCYARLVKTRTLASKLVQGGKVRINRKRTDKPGSLVKIDDVVTVAVHGRVRVLKVLAPGIRRGPPVEATELYEDLTPADTITGQKKKIHGGPLKQGGERPTKRNRRAIDRLRYSDFE